MGSAIGGIVSGGLSLASGLMGSGAASSAGSAQVGAANQAAGAINAATNAALPALSQAQNQSQSQLYTGLNQATATQAPYGLVGGEALDALAGTLGLATPSIGSANVPQVLNSYNSAINTMANDVQGQYDSYWTALRGYNQGIGYTNGRNVPFYYGANTPQQNIAPGTQFGLGGGSSGAAGRAGNNTAYLANGSPLLRSNYANTGSYQAAVQALGGGPGAAGGAGSGNGTMTAGGYTAPSIFQDPNAVEDPFASWAYNSGPSSSVMDGALAHALKPSLASVLQQSGYRPDPMNPGTPANQITLQQLAQFNSRDEPGNAPQVPTFDTNINDYWNSNPQQRQFVSAYNNGTLGTSNGSMVVTPYQQVLNNFFQNPGYQFQLSQGLQAVQNSASASGLLNSGQFATALNNYAQGLANTSWSQYQDKLASLAGLGSATATNLSNQQVNTASNLSNSSQAYGQDVASTLMNQGTGLANAALAAGNAQAGATLAGSNALSSGFGGAANSLSNALSSLFSGA